MSWRGGGEVLGSCVLGSRVLGHGSWVVGRGSGVLRLGSWVSPPESFILPLASYIFLLASCAHDILAGSLMFVERVKRTSQSG